MRMVKGRKEGGEERGDKGEKGEYQEMFCIIRLIMNQYLFVIVKIIFVFRQYLFILNFIVFIGIRFREEKFFIRLIIF